MINMLTNLWKDESGQDAAEYALLLVLIAVVLVLAITSLRGAIQAAFLRVAGILNGAS
jgi:Flp pilus assembly pilin Flp